MIYNFILIISGVTYDIEGLEDALYESGCDDGFICAYGDNVYMEFDREAEYKYAAIASAVRDVESAALGAKVEAVYASWNDLVKGIKFGESSKAKRYA